MMVDKFFLLRSIYRVKKMKIKPFIIYCFCLLPLLTNSYAEQAVIAAKIENMPLYLLTIEFYKPEANVIEKAKQSLQNKQAVILHKQLSLPPFHQRKHLSIKEKMASKDGSFCLTCHLPLPHQENIRTRTFNNMHSRYIACETCHLDAQKIPARADLDYRWFDFKQRTPVNKSTDLFTVLFTTLYTIPSTRSEDKNIKITPFYQQKTAVITRQHLYAEQLSKDWKEAALATKASIKAQIHQPLKAEAEQCSQCHTKTNSLFSLLSLGASEQQLKRYQNNSIVAFFSHYGTKDNVKDNKENTRTGSPQDQPQAIQRIRLTELLN